MPVTNWQTTVIDGKNWLVIDLAKLRIPLEWDETSGVFLAVAAPDGGIFNHPALLQGDDGAPPDLDENINFTALDFDDATPEFASFTKTGDNLYQLNLGLRNGQKGDDGGAVLDPDDYGTPLAGRLLRVKADLSGFEYTPQMIGNRYLPASITAVPTGNPGYTQCIIPIDAQPFDYYVEVEGQSTITGAGSDVRADLVARLSSTTTGLTNAETAGPVVGRGFGGVGVNTLQIATVMSPGPPPGSSPSYDRVAAGVASSVYVRTERQSGANTYSTDTDTTRYRARVFAAL